MRHSIPMWLRLIVQLSLVMAITATWGIPEWPVYQVDDPMTEALMPTGPELHWDAATPQGETRLFLSNHPETITSGTPEGKLLTDDVQATSPVTYRVFFQHYNYRTQPIYLAVILENLTDDSALLIGGSYITTRGTFRGVPKPCWSSMKNVGKYNAYAELSGQLRAPLSEQTVRKGAGETSIVQWKINPGDLLGGRMWLTIRRATGTGTIKYRLSTVWALQQQSLTRQLALIPVGQHHPRGCWPTSELSLTNRQEAFDLAREEQDGRTVRWIRICQPVYVNGIKVRYTDEVIYTKDASANPAQSISNNGLYGAVINTHLCVKNSGQQDARVGIYLRYPVKDLEGAYVGAATTYTYDEAMKQWTVGETKAVDLSRLTYSPEPNDRDWWWTTQCLAAYPVKAGETREIPLTLTNDGPAMLPLAIVLRKE